MPWCFHKGFSEPTFLLCCYPGTRIVASKEATQDPSILRCLHGSLWTVFGCSRTVVRVRSQLQRFWCSDRMPRLVRSNVFVNSRTCSVSRCDCFIHDEQVFVLANCEQVFGIVITMFWSKARIVNKTFGFGEQCSKPAMSIQSMGEKKRKILKETIGIPREF